MVATPADERARRTLESLKGRFVPESVIMRMWPIWLIGA